MCLLGLLAIDTPLSASFGAACDTVSTAGITVTEFWRRGNGWGIMKDRAELDSIGSPTQYKSRGLDVSYIQELKRKMPCYEQKPMQRPPKKTQFFVSKFHLLLPPAPLP